MAKQLESVRLAAFDKLAQWMYLWNVDAKIQDSSPENILQDLRDHSPKDHDKVLHEHDHDLYILHPSIGDEAGYWTLYVVVHPFIPTGFIGTPGHLEVDLRTPRIHAIWQVFDLKPAQIYTLDEQFDQEVGRTVPHERLMNVPEDTE